MEPMSDLSTKFNHSIKVPRLYKTACKIAKQVREEGASLKQLVYDKKHPNIKALYALVLKTLQNEDKLNFVIRHSNILLKENQLDPWLARVLISELLWGKKSLPGESKPVKTVLSYHDTFLQQDIPISIKSKHKDKKVFKPKYVRINTLKTTMPEAIDVFRNEGWSLVRCGDGSDYAAFVATAASLSDDQFMVDIHVKELLIFPPGTEFYQHEGFKNGYFVLQDKASCLAPVLLNPPVGAIVLDMCAAPGMKTTQLACMVGEKGTVHAVERNERRYETLVKLLEKADCKNVVKPINKDVLTLTENDIKDVEYILVDPSCSGSGMLDRLNLDDEESKCNESRLQKLAGFQITLLRHALTNFSSAKQILYSTCSIYPQENEEVVQQAIITTPNYKLVSLKNVMKGKWYNFGSEKYGDIGQKCLYALPDIDHTNGFFVALFERVKDNETNPYFIKRLQRTSECENKQEIENNESSEEVCVKQKKKKIMKNEIGSQNSHTNIEKEISLEKSTSIFKKKKKKEKFINSELNDNIDIMMQNEDVTKNEQFTGMDNIKKQNKKRKERDEYQDMFVENMKSQSLSILEKYDKFLKLDDTKKQSKKRKKHSFENNTNEKFPEVDDVSKLEKKKKQHKDRLEDMTSNVKQNKYNEEKSVENIEPQHKPLKKGKMSDNFDKIFKHNDLEKKDEFTKLNDVKKQDKKQKKYKEKFGNIV